MDYLSNETISSLLEPRKYEHIIVMKQRKNAFIILK